MLLQKQSLRLSGLIASLTILLLSMHSMAQSCMEGKLVDASNGRAVQGATIWFSGQKGLTSDQEGKFKLCDLPSDTVEVKISYVGYESLVRKIYLHPGKNEAISISLKPSAVLMDELVVTATRTENQVLNTPVRVNIISPRMLQNAPMQNIDDVIKLAPGINCSRPFGIFSTKAIVTMRGLSGKEQGRVLVLLDGVPLNKSDGGTVDWNLVDINSVQKVEITKGAGSAIYGGNAMGGIINIITRPPSDKLFLRASMEYGTFNTLGGKLNIGGAKKLKNSSRSFFWLANTWYKQSDGYITQSEADQRLNPYITKSNMKEAGANLKAGCSLGANHHIMASLNYYNDHRGTGEKEFQPDGNVTDHDSYGGTMKYDGSIRHIQVNSALYLLTENYKKVNEYIKDDYTWYHVLSVRRDYGWFTTLSGSSGRNQLVTGGFDYRNGSVDAYDKYYTSTDIVYNKGKMNTYAMFVQDEIRFTEKLRAIAGLRYDMATFHDGAFYIEASSVETSFMRGFEVPDMPVKHWNALSPRISVQYGWKPNHRVYAMYSRGFRPSVLDDLCRSGRIKGGFKIANPSLKPEYLDNWETGLDLNPLSKVFFSASLFYTLGTDFQYYVSNGQTIDMGFGDRPIFVRANISKVEIYGGESEVKVEITPALIAFANYSYTHSVIRDYRKIADNDTIDLSGKYLTDVPEHIITAGITWTNRLLNSGVSVHYNGPMYINDQNSMDEILLSTQYEGYTTVDMKVGKEFMKHYKISLNIQNLFNKKYYDSKDAVCPGRFITMEAGVSF
jgi:iron complex outermembrane recepter protein